MLPLSYLSLLPFLSPSISYFFLGLFPFLFHIIQFTSLLFLLLSLETALFVSFSQQQNTRDDTANLVDK